MLMIYKQFLLRYGTLNSQYLSSFNINKIDQVHLPKNVTFHYIDQSVNTLFPSRHNYHFKDIDKAKKIRILNIPDLYVKDDVTSKQNLYLPNDIRTWKQSHQRTFRAQDLLKEKVNDEFNMGVFNYNTLNDLYFYRNSALANYNRNYNVIKTFAHYLKESLKANPNSLNLVTLDIPNVLFGFNAMRKLIIARPVKRARLVNDPSMYWLLEWYLWLIDKPNPVSMESNEDLLDDNEDDDVVDDILEEEEKKEEQALQSTGTRHLSVFKDITDEESDKILLELRYRGCVSYIPLSIFRSLSINSSIPAMKKLKDIRLQKFFLNYIFQLQKQMAAMGFTPIQSETIVEDDTDEEAIELIETSSLPEPLTDDAVNTLQIDVKSKFKEDKPKTLFGRAIKKIKEMDKEAYDVIEETLFKNKKDDKTDIFNNLNESVNEGIDNFIEKKDNKYSLMRRHKEVTEEVTEIDVPNDKDAYLETNIEIEAEDLPTEDDSPITEVEKKELLTSSSVNTQLNNYIEEGTYLGIVATADARKLRKTQEVRSRLVDPYDKAILVDQVTLNPKPVENFTAKEIDLPIKNDLVDPKYATDKIQAFDKVYIDEYMKQDVVRSVMNVENGGALVTKYEVEEVQSSIDKYEKHSITLQPIKGKQSTVNFRIPKVDDYGTYMISGRKYRSRKLKQDLPIRKISSTRVALISNYGKFFISRVTRAAYDREAFILKTIKQLYLSGTSDIITLIPKKRKMNDIKGLPNTYYMLASNFDKIETKKEMFLFSPDELSNVLTDDVLKLIKKDKLIPIGYDKKTNDVLAMNQDEEIINFTTKASIGLFTDLVNIPSDKLPKPFSMMKVLGLDIPLCVCLSYYMGLSGLIRLMEVEYKLLPSNKQVKGLTKDQAVFRFNDYKLVLTLDTPEKKLMFYGLYYYKDFIKSYGLKSFDDKAIYLNLIEFRGGGIYYLKELECLDMLFLDPITQDVLKMIKEPSEFRPLLLRAHQMLTTFDHPDINDPSFVRIRGYDRIAGMVYKCLSESMRNHHIKGRVNSKVELDPYKVWNMIGQDSTLQPREALNPLAYTKEDEAVTLVGEGGLKSGAVPTELRRFHEKDTGVFTESTVDSKDVAISTNLSRFARIENVRGLIGEGFEEVNETKSKVYSTTNQIAPFTEFDDKLNVVFKLL